MGSPALMDAQADRILSLLNGVIDFANNNVQAGGAGTDGGTTQASGANTAPNIDIDIAAILVAAVGGTTLAVAAATDVDPDAGDQITWGATSGVTALVDVRLIAAGTFLAVAGTVAATGLENPPTQAQIDAIVGEGVASALVTRATVTRTGDATITITFDDTVRLTMAGLLPLALSASEIDFAVGGAARVSPIVQDPPP